MEREIVESSNILSIGYDKNNSILEIEFIKSGLYQYDDVPEYEYQNLMAADSKGSYFSKNIKNSFRSSKIG